VKFIKLDEFVINLDMVAWAERQGGTGNVTVHFTVPRASTVPGITMPMHGTPAVASDHYAITVTGPHADTLWAELTKS
jgi:hypothetical protein